MQTGTMQRIAHEFGSLVVPHGRVLSTGLHSGCLKLKISPETHRCAAVVHRHAFGHLRTHEWQLGQHSGAERTVYIYLPN